jgi:GT2 family glycosyltransferase
MLVSTIIPVHNRPDLLVSAVESALQQTHRPIEVIIVDDGSTDATPAVASKLVANHPENIIYIRQENRGAGPAREAGRLAARGEFIQYLDSDDRLLPNKFKDQITALREHPECDIAYGRTRLVDANGKTLVEPFKWTGRENGFLFPALLVDRWWSTHTPLYRRSVCDAIGPWTDLKYSQDWEYDARAGALGTRLVNCNTWVSEHTHHDGFRQTGTGRWLASEDQLRFFQSLHTAAVRAGVGITEPEMRHFSRWVFSQARKAGASGESKAAQELFDLAVHAAGGMDRGMQWTSQLARIAGWRITGGLAELAGSMLGRKAGPGTLRQSWMEPKRR